MGRRRILPLPEGYYDDTDKTCRHCHGPLAGRRTRFCTNECADMFGNLRDWRGLRLLAMKRDDHTCRECGKSGPRKFLEVDHIIPIADGGREFDLENTRTVCKDCHKVITAAWHKARRDKKRGNAQGVLFS